MKWATREHIHIDRCACAWLIRAPMSWGTSPPSGLRGRAAIPMSRRSKLCLKTSSAGGRKNRCHRSSRRSARSAVAASVCDAPRAITARSVQIIATVQI
ncbi:chromate resistance protein ChrB domain-containing protein [Rhizocola hellebori]|uniref:chromate resistance protein ChrB domain-containing protein n=1 Tax=Rhizocola hellebori TaxID=1392758 RepID=UPI00194103E6